VQGLWLFKSTEEVIGGIMDKIYTWNYDERRIIKLYRCNPKKLIKELQEKVKKSGSGK